VKHGSQWHHYARSHLGDQTFDFLGEEHQASLTSLLTEHYQNNRTTALSTRTLDADTLHLPSVRKILQAQGYDSTEIERVIGGMRDIATFHNQEFDAGRIPVGTGRRMILSEAEKADTLTKNPITGLVAGIHSRGAGQRPIISVGSSAKPSAIVSEAAQSAKVATRAIGDSTAGRSFLSGVASSASGAKVLQLARSGRKMLQSFA
jgi:hypothetical protein